MTTLEITNQAREAGIRPFQPSVISWSYLSRGKVALIQRKMKTIR